MEFSEFDVECIVKSISTKFLNRYVDDSKLLREHICVLESDERTECETLFRWIEEWPLAGAKKLLVLKTKFAQEWKGLPEDEKQLVFNWCLRLRTELDETKKSMKFFKYALLSFEQSYVRCSTYLKRRLPVDLLSVISQYLPFKDRSDNTNKIWFTTEEDRLENNIKTRIESEWEGFSTETGEYKKEEKEGAAIQKMEKGQNSKYIYFPRDARTPCPEYADEVQLDDTLIRWYCRVNTENGNRNNVQKLMIEYGFRYPNVFSEAKTALEESDNPRLLHAALGTLLQTHGHEMHDNLFVYLTALDDEQFDNPTKLAALRLLLEDHAHEMPPSRFNAIMNLAQDDEALKKMFKNALSIALQLHGHQMDPDIWEGVVEHAEITTQKNHRPLFYLLASHTHEMSTSRFNAIMNLAQEDEALKKMFKEALSTALRLHGSEMDANTRMRVTGWATNAAGVPEGKAEKEDAAEVEQPMGKEPVTASARLLPYQVLRKNPGKAAAAGTLATLGLVGLSMASRKKLKKRNPGNFLVST